MRILTEYVSPEVFGTLALLLAVNALGSNLFCAPILQASLRYYPEYAVQGQAPLLRRTILNLLAPTTILLVAVMLVGGVVYSALTGASYWGVLAAAALIVAEVYRTFEITLLTAARRQRPSAFWQASEAIARPLLAILAVLFLGSTSGAVLLGYCLATLAIALFGHACIRLEGIGDSEAVDRAQPQLRASIRQLALPLVPLALMSWIHSSSDRYLIVGLLDLPSVGIYSAAYGLASRPLLMLNGILLTTIRPAYYHAVSDLDQDLANSLLRQWLLLAVSASTVVVLGYQFFGNEIVGLLLAKEYHASTGLIPAIGLGIALMCISHIYNHISLAYKRSTHVLASESCSALGAAVLTLPLISLYGLLGAAFSVPARFALQLSSAYWFSRLARTHAG